MEKNFFLGTFRLYMEVGFPKHYFCDTTLNSNTLLHLQSFLASLEIRHIYVQAL